MGLLDAACGFGDAEVEDARHAVGPDQDVLRRDVAVHDLEGLAQLVGGFVGGVQAGQDAGEDGDGDAGGELLAAVAQGAQELEEGLALHVVHDEEQLAPDGDDIEGGDDVGVVDPGGEAGFVAEHRDELGVASEVGVQALDGDGAGEADGAEGATDEHGGHASGGDLTVQRIATDGARGRRDRGRLIHRRGSVHQGEGVRDKAA